MPESFSINRLHELTGVDRRTIKKRVTAAGVLPTGDGYPSAEALKAIFGDSKKKTEDIAISEARIFAANARTAEVKAARAESAVIETTAVELAWAEIVILITQKLDLIVPKFRSRYVVGMDVNAAAKIVEQDLEDVRNDLSKPVHYKESEDAEDGSQSDAEVAASEAEAAD